VTAILYGLSVLILSCAVSWLFSRLRNGRPRRRPLLSRQEMRALRRVKLRALENPTPYQLLDRTIRERVLTLDQALRLDGMQKARGCSRRSTPAGQRNSGPLSPESKLASPTADETPRHTI